MFSLVDLRFTATQRVQSQLGTAQDSLAAVSQAAVSQAAFYGGSVTAAGAAGVAVLRLGCSNPVPPQPEMGLVVNFHK